MEVKVIRSEMIKPSNPIPPHLRRHCLSFLDQLEPRILTPFVYFFSHHQVPHPSPCSSVLKRSLSEALTLFYPLAGRIVGNLYIDCDDEGVRFTETRVSCRLSDVLVSADDLCPNLERLFPAGISAQEDYVAAVQFNIFECGGVAIGIGVSHRVGDASSYFEFIRSWAGITRSGSLKREDWDSLIPRIVSDEIFPGMSPIDHDPLVVPVETLVTKRFVFSDESLAAIRGKYGHELRLSRVDALTEFILQRHVQVTLKASPNVDHIKYMVSYVINLRPRLSPPLAASAFGNIITTFHFELPFTRDGNETSDCKLIPLVRDAVAGANSPEFTTKFRETRLQIEFLKERLDRAQGKPRGDMPSVTLNFASLSRFPVYEADFGWGKPEWVGFAGSSRMNHVIFVDGKEGKSMEAYVALKDEEMKRFQTDPEIVAYTESTSAKATMTGTRPRM
ncbi:hypothetical protein MLD38_025477 [Melastoma candidum]|uniref:Uncharacterized protein n=1 Tax=Melastoma candidum TaxID=119954 RepID=A0ACB9NYE0_9MYRT|nr:hypothetical protein MLD38_025477 [Melastoma candidum]